MVIDAIAAPITSFFGPIVSRQISLDLLLVLPLWMENDFPESREVQIFFPTLRCLIGLSAGVLNCLQQFRPRD